MSNEKILEMGDRLFSWMMRPIEQHRDKFPTDRAFSTYKILLDRGYTKWGAYLQALAEEEKLDRKTAMETPLNDIETYQIRINIENAKEYFVGSVVGVDGVIVGQGNTSKEALEDTISALLFHLKTFGKDAIKRIAVSKGQ